MGPFLVFISVSLLFPPSKCKLMIVVGYSNFKHASATINFNIYNYILALEVFFTSLGKVDDITSA